MANSRGCARRVSSDRFGFRSGDGGIVALTLSKHVEQIRTLVDDRDLVSSNRHLLADTATRLFRAKGYHKTSTRDIATEAGMSVGAIYQYIRHKEDLVVLILQSFFEIYQKRIGSLVDAPGSATVRLHKVVDIYYRLLDEHHAKTDVLYHNFSGLGAQARNYLVDIEENVTGLMRRLLEQGIAEGAFRPVNTHFLAHNIVSMGHMWALKRRRFRNIMTLDDYIREQQTYLDMALKQSAAG
jgi:AcrR family transcriptional regulator